MPKRFVKATGVVQRKLLQACRKRAPREGKRRTTDTSSRRKVQRTSVSRVRGKDTHATGMCQVTATSTGRHRFEEEDTVQPLMDLALPRFDKSDDRMTP